MTVVVDRVSVSPKSEMLQGVQAGERVEASHQVRGGKAHQIGLDKFHVRNDVWNISDVHDDYRAEGSNVSGEAVDPGSDINMPDRAVLVDSPRHQEILV